MATPEIGTGYTCSTLGQTGLTIQVSTARTANTDVVTFRYKYREIYILNISYMG